MPDGPDVRMTLNYILDSSKEKFGDRSAIGMAMESPITYEELHDRICALAAGLMERGLGHGDRVAILAENSHNWGTALAGSGCRFCPICPRPTSTISWVK